ncbi:thermonuclease family protein [Desulfosoma sp.]
MKRRKQRDAASGRRVRVKERWGAAFFCALLVFAWHVPTACAGFGKPRKDENPPKIATVIAVLDGDTVVLENGSKVRYLGVDTPEMDHETGRHECYAREAYTRNKALVLGRRVILAYDTPTRDEHGRLLAYVSTPEGISVNAELVREGLAYVFRGPEGFSRFREFLALQRDAVLARRGMHGRCPVREEKSYLGNRASFIFHRPACPFGAKTHPDRRIVFTTRWDALMEGYRPCRRCSP